MATHVLLRLLCVPASFDTSQPTACDESIIARAGRLSEQETQHCIAQVSYLEVLHFVSVAFLRRITCDRTHGVGPLVSWCIAIAEPSVDAGLLVLGSLQVACLRLSAKGPRLLSNTSSGSIDIWVVGLDGHLHQLRASPSSSVELVHGHVAELIRVPSQQFCFCQNGRLCQLDLLLSEIGHGAVLRVRAFPLRGGVARDLESLKTFLATLLISHGVPQDVLPKRIQTIVDKVPVSSLRHVASNENPWNTLKSICNDHMVRILQPEELKAYSEMRKLQKQSSSLLPRGLARGCEGGHQSGKSSASSRAPLPAVHATEVDPKTMHVDVQHFRVPDGGGLLRRDSDKFPSDGPGLYVMQLDHIMPYLPPRPIHLDATVVFVLGRLAPGAGKFIELPACDAHGRPILVPGTIVQFGGVAAEFVASCPSVDFEPVPATPVEIKIVRDLVSDEWELVAVDPMSFAAQAIPALKADGVISHSRALHFYSELRKKCRSRDAQHFHGYFLILDAALEAALRDSGTKGVFLCPRSPDKTRDHRFRVIPCVGSLEVIKAKAHGCERALGLTQLQSGILAWGPVGACC